MKCALRSSLHSLIACGMSISNNNNGSFVVYEPSDILKQPKLFAHTYNTNNNKNSRNFATVASSCLTTTESDMNTTLTSPLLSALRSTSSVKHDCKCYCTALLLSQRHVGNYPAPMPKKVREGFVKPFNFLSTQRIVESPKKLSRMEERKRDDKFLTARSNYYQEVLRDVEEKVHYYEPFIKSYIFFKGGSAYRSMTFFHGSYAQPIRMHTRLYIHVLDQICRGSHRKTLQELMRNCNIEVPPASVWEEFSDPVTKDLNCGILYSRWMTSRFIAIDRMKTMSKKHRHQFMTLINAYVLIHHKDCNTVQSLAQWAHKCGKLKPEECRPQRSLNDKLKIKNQEAIAVVPYYGRSEIEKLVSTIPLEEQYKLKLNALENFDELYESFRRHNLLAAKIQLVMNSLPEIRAINKIERTYANDKTFKWYIAHKGSFWPKISIVRKEFANLQPEEKVKYACFGRVYISRTLSGRQLYNRFCVRDYGLTRSEAMERFSSLSELQRAALNFPFYAPIRPRNSSVVAFNRFFNETCRQLGFLHLGRTETNKMFFVAIKRKWNSMTDEERRSYERPDDLHKIFPLQPITNEPVYAIGTPSPTTKPEKSDREKSKIKNTQARSKAVSAKATFEVYELEAYELVPKEYLLDEYYQ